LGEPLKPEGEEAILVRSGGRENRLFLTITSEKELGGRNCHLGAWMRERKMEQQTTGNERKKKERGGWIMGKVVWYSQIRGLNP